MTVCYCVIVRGLKYEKGENLDVKIAHLWDLMYHKPVMFEPLRIECKRARGTNVFSIV